MNLFPQTKWQRIRLAILTGIALAVVVYCYGLPLAGFMLYTPQTGDIVFQPLQPNPLVRMIEGATGSPYSHCGVVVKDGDSWVVYQAYGTVTKTPLFNYVTQGRFGRFAVYRLKPEYQHVLPDFIKALDAFLGMPYDIHYAMGDDEIYCSELIYKAFFNATGEKLGRLVTLGELNWEPYVETMKKIENSPPPLDRVMITPKHLSEADQLMNVFSFLL